ncbi:Uncharacterised protein [Vibrio cholerae]|nr:Uncharacterised protein [Vibrio cholerae]
MLPPNTPHSIKGVPRAIPNKALCLCSFCKASNCACCLACCCAGSSKISAW